MNEQIIPALGRFDPIDPIGVRAPELAAANQRPMTEEILPFTVKLVRDNKDLSKAVDIRQSAYARHLPEFAKTLGVPEPTDSQDGVVVLLAESKLDGSALGTMRIQTNRYNPLSLEQSVDLPDWLRVRPLAQAARLGVTDDKSGRMVKTVLFKAFFQFCQQTGIEWMVIAARAPIDRQYQRLLFSDVVTGMGFIPLLQASNIPHRVMSFEIATAKARWAEANHPLLDFMCNTHHPDIDIGGHDFGNRSHAPGMLMPTPAMLM